MPAKREGKSCFLRASRAATAASAAEAPVVGVRDPGMQAAQSGPDYQQDQYAQWRKRDEEGTGKAQGQ